ncbi:hypothetical protein ACHAXR_000178 [Thalassiosira sp. AJA248-18]
MGATIVPSDDGLGFQQAMPISIYEHATKAASAPLNELDECDACLYCKDTCADVESCIACQKKIIANTMNVRCRGPEKSWFMGALSSICPNPQDNGQSNDTYTMCQLRRHNHANSAWILVGDTIYDATPYIRSHPGGVEAIVKKSGGAVDCTEDLRFHSNRAQKEWRKFKVGTLCCCPHGHRK